MSKIANGNWNETKWQPLRAESFTTFLAEKEGK